MRAAALQTSPSSRCDLCCSRHQPMMTLGILGGAATSDISTVGKPASISPIQRRHARFAPHLRLPSALLLIVCSSITPDTKPVPHAEPVSISNFYNGFIQGSSASALSFQVSQRAACRKRRCAGSSEEARRNNCELQDPYHQQRAQRTLRKKHIFGFWNKSTDGDGLATLRQGLCRQAEAPGRRRGAQEAGRCPGTSGHWRRIRKKSQFNSYVQRDTDLSRSTTRRS
jgi:hypothetical protein